MLEALNVSDGIHQDDPMCTFVEGFSDVTETLLSCSVPDVQCDRAPINFHSLDFKIHSNGT